MRTINKVVYRLPELEGHARDEALDYVRQGLELYDWWEPVYADATEVGARLGFVIDDIRFSGFWSQGDGASFTGSWAAEDVKVGEAKKMYPMDEELHAIAAEIERIATEALADARLEDDVVGENVPSLSIRRRSGNYVHEHTVDIDCIESDEHGEELADVTRDFMRWIYARLEEEYEWLTGEEQLIEHAEINDMEFDEDGNIA